VQIKKQETIDYRGSIVCVSSYSYDVTACTSLNTTGRIRFRQSVGSCEAMQNKVVLGSHSNIIKTNSVYK
jgi:hypothetical protein